MNFVKTLFFCCVFVIIFFSNSLGKNNSNPMLNARAKNCEKPKTFTKPNIIRGTIFVRNLVFWSGLSKSKIVVQAINNENNEPINCVIPTQNSRDRVLEYEIQVPQLMDITINILPQNSFVGGSYNWNGSSCVNGICPRQETPLSPSSPILYPKNPNLVKVIADEVIEFSKITGLTDEAVLTLMNLDTGNLTDFQKNYLTDAKKKIRNISIDIHKISEQDLANQDKSWEVMDQVIRNSYSKLPLNEMQLSINLMAVKDETNLFEIRKVAIKNLYNNLPTDKIKNEALDFFRAQSQNPQSDLFIPSLTGLYNLGDNADKQFVIKGIYSKDKTQSIAFLNALGNANFETSQDKIDLYIVVLSMQKIIATNELDMELKESAIMNLGKLAKTTKEKPINTTLIKIGENQPDLRKQVIESIPTNNLTKIQRNKIKTMQRSIDN